MEEQQNWLRRQESKKKWEEERQKKQELEALRAKELLQFEFRKEIETCDSLILLLSGFKEGKKDSNEVPNAEGEY